MAAPLILRIIGDATSYFKTAESTIATNTKIAGSFKSIGPAATLSADAQIAAGVKALRAQEASLAALQRAQRLTIAGTKERIVADVALAAAQDRVNRSMGISTVGLTRTSAVAKETERDFGKLTRGVLAGSGVFSALGRSLAFASGSFLLFAGGATLISRSIRAAQTLAATERQVGQQLSTTGKSWDDYKDRIEKALTAQSHLSGFPTRDLLEGFGFIVRVSGNVTRSLQLEAVAANVARARHITLASASLALGKALGGSLTALRRLGIVIPPNVKGMEALAFVAHKFAGQAAAGATVSDKLHATLERTSEIIGQELLPTFERLATRFTKWLQDANETGRLQRDVNEVLRSGKEIFHDLGRAIGLVDKVTGSFATTLKILVELRFAYIITQWVGGLTKLTTAWQGVTVAAGEAAAAERAALGGGAAAGAAAGAAGSSVVSRVAAYTGGVATASKFARLGALGSVAGALFGAQQDSYPLTDPEVHKDGYVWYHSTVGGKGALIRGGRAKYDSPTFPGGHNSFPGLPAFLGGQPRGQGGSTATMPTMPKISQWAGYQLNVTEQIAQANAALTKSTQDDVAAAKRVIARIKRVIAAGHLHGAALVQALQAEGSALATIWAAEDAAAQKRAAAAQAAQEKIAAQIQNSIDPIRLEVALSRAQALGKPIRKILRELRAAAQKALHSGKLSLEQQKEAWDQIASINERLKDQSHAATAWFKQANTRLLTAGLGLTDAQRAELRARLSHLDASGKVSREGVGAYGYEIGHSGRPIHVHTTVKLDGKKVASSTTKHQQRTRRRNSSQRRGPNAGG